MYVLEWEEKHPDYVGKTFELFRIQWSQNLVAYVKNPDGPHWGIYHPKNGKIVRLYEKPETYGKVKEKDTGINIKTKIVMGKPTLSEFDKHIHDITDKFFEELENEEEE